MVMTSGALLTLCCIIAAYSQVCPPQCSTCASLTSCSACNQGFFVVNQTFCSPCPIGCTNCFTGGNGVPTCDACSLGYQLSSDGKCFLCDPQCQDCLGVPNNCTLCRDGQQLQVVNGSGRCGPLQNCPFMNCAQCSGDSTYCQRCLSGYFNFFQQCVPCRFPCKTCSVNITQQWQNISAFWTVVVGQILNITAPFLPPGSLPPFLQNLNFSAMDQQTMIGWATAYYVYQTIASFLPNTTTTQTLIMEAIQLFPTIATLPADQQVNAVLARLSQIAGRNITTQMAYKKFNQITSGIAECSQCANGYQISPVAPVCVNCPPNCALCSSGVCTLCQPGFYNSSATCTPCDTNCALCDVLSSNCTACRPPMMLDSSTCILCAQPCLTCTSANSSFCLTCKLPFSLTAVSGTCFRCAQDSCLECDSTNTSICIQCRNGSSLVNSRCTVCPQNCLTCLIGVAEVPPLCFLCINGFVLSSTNGTCIPCNPGCLLCTQTQCLRCQEGLFLNYTIGRCQRCRQGCTACIDIQTCTAFQQGTVIIGDYTITCRPGCKSCDTTNPQICLVCQQRFYLDSGICKSCGVGCQSCTSATVCTQCFENNYPSATNLGECQRCQGQCLTCLSSNLTSCLSCKRGTVLIGNECRKVCSFGCLQCDPSNNSICIKCDQGHTLNQNRQCIKCLGSCSGTCDARNITVCLGCVNGFELNSNQCVRCPIGCTSCLNGQCSQCVFGFIIAQSAQGNFVCKQKCRSPCLTCSGDTCFSCQYGYNLTNGRCVPDLSCNPSCQFCPQGTQKAVTGQCVPCPTSCSSCLGGVCFQCFGGFYLSSTHTCQACPSQCRTCFNNQSCDICSSGFVKQITTMSSGVSDATYSDRCIPCDPNCRSCIVQPERCTSCFDGFRLFSFRCAGLFTVVYNYELDIAFSTFLDSASSQQFIDALSAMTGVNSSDNYITYVREGSTQFGGTISASDSASASTIQAGLGSSVPGYTVLSSGSSVYYSDTPYKQPQQQQKENKGVNIGLIVGVVIGGIALVSLVIFIIYKLKQKKLTQINRQQDQLAVVDNRITNDANSFNNFDGSSNQKN